MWACEATERAATRSQVVHAVQEIETKSNEYVL